MVGVSCWYECNLKLTKWMEFSLSQIETNTVSPPGEVAMFISGYSAAVISILKEMSNLVQTFHNSWFTLSTYFFVNTHYPSSFAWFIPQSFSNSIATQAYVSTLHHVRHIVKQNSCLWKTTSDTSLGQMKTCYINTMWFLCVTSRRKTFKATQIDDWPFPYTWLKMYLLNY